VFGNNDQQEYSFENNHSKYFEDSYHPINDQPIWEELILTYSLGNIYNTYSYPNHSSRLMSNPHLNCERWNKTYKN
jgi:hypothetical protein